MPLFPCQPRVALSAENGQRMATRWEGSRPGERIDHPPPHSAASATPTTWSRCARQGTTPAQYVRGMPWEVS